MEVYVKIEIQRQTRVYGDTEIQRQRGVCYMEIIDKQYRVKREVIIIEDIERET